MPEIDLSEIKGKHLPEKKFRSGSIYLTIWNNRKRVKHDKVSYFYTITLERRYKKGKEWKSSNTYRVNDLPRAVLLLNKAYEYLVIQKSGKEIVEEISGN